MGCHLDARRRATFLIASNCLFNTAEYFYKSIFIKGLDKIKTDEWKCPAVLHNFT